MATRTAHKLTNEQRDQLREWLAADYDTRLIMAWFQERGWPMVARSTIHHYRQSDAVDIERIRGERRSAALTSGLAVKEERVERLKRHADRLEEIKWEPDEKGNLRNEKAWRETVQQIADELEPKKIDHTNSDGSMRPIAYQFVPYSKPNDSADTDSA